MAYITVRDLSLGYDAHSIMENLIGTKIFFGTKEEYLESNAGKFFLMQQKGGEDNV